jgi:hypothetical protein
MTSRRFRTTWGRLACAVLELAMEDLDADRTSGFSACPASERKKWKKDAVRFFEDLSYRTFSESAGFQWHEIESAYELKMGEEK